MLLFVCRRLAQLLPVLLIILCVNFLLVHLAPGDPVTYLAGDSATPEYIEALRAQYGLDRPLYVQLFAYLAAVASGDLGTSFVSHEPVMNVLASRLPASLLLFSTQFILSIVIGVVLGVVSARRRGSLVDQAVSVLSLVGFAVPAFWLAQMLVILFSLQLGLFPSQGMRTLRFEQSAWEAALDVAHHLVLPVVTLTIFNLALIARITRASMITALGQEYVVFARSKGVPESDVLWRHAFRNAVLPVVTIIGLNIRTLIAGAVLTETVFAWPGIGRLTYDSIVARDYPVLMGVFLLIGIAVVIGNLLADIAYAVLDPRVRYR
jgi:peptide/nickel transport system permease protein